MSITLSILLHVATATPIVQPSGDWPTWRGPTGDGVAAPNVTPPLTWSESENVRWKVEIDGLGNSTPVIVGDRIYLTTAIDLGGEEPTPDASTDVGPGPQPGPPRAEHEHEYVVLALERASGKEIWRTTVGKGKPDLKQHETGSYASPSVALDGDRIIASFGSHGLYGLTLDGSVVWSKDLGNMTVLADFGEGSTPIAHDGVVVLQWDEEGPSFVAGFRTADGEEIWRRPRESDSSWGSPSIATVDGEAQVILGGSDATIAYDLRTGRTIWTLGGFSKNPTVSTLVHDGILYAMNSYKGNVIHAVRIEGAKGALDGTDAVLWTANRTAPYVPTPVAHDGLLYFNRDSTGVLECVDAKTGERRYSGKRLGGMKRIHASPIVAAGHLYFVSREGTAIVVKAGPEFEIVAENQLDDVFDATPAFVGNAIYLRGRSSLYCLAAD